MIHRNRKKTRAFTLAELIFAVLIISVLTGLAMPSFIRARMRAQAISILNEARQLDAAKDQYCLEN